MVEVTLTGLGVRRAIAKVGGTVDERTTSKRQPTRGRQLMNRGSRRALGLLVVLATAPACSRPGSVVGPDSSATFTMGPERTVVLPTIAPGTMEILDEQYQYVPLNGQADGYRPYQAAPVTIAIGTTVRVLLTTSFVDPSSSNPSVLVLVSGSSPAADQERVTVFRATRPGTATLTAKYRFNCNGNTRACPATRSLTVVVG